MTKTGIRYRPRQGAFGSKRLTAGRSRSSGAFARGPGLVEIAPRVLMSLVVVVAFLMCAVFSGPATHRSIETDIPSSVLLMKDVAKAPGEAGTPVKSLLPGLCNGHCAAHTLTLPALLLLPAAPFVLRATWWVFDDQVGQVTRPALLERPPRV